MNRCTRTLQWLIAAALMIFLVGCDQGLHFSIRFEEPQGLQAGDSMLQNNQIVGHVLGVEPQADQGELIQVVVDRQFAGAATIDSKFYVIDDPKQPQHKSIDVQQSRPGGKPLTEGAVVIGSTRSVLNSLFPMREILKEFGGMLKDLRNQVEDFRQQFEQLPDTKEAHQLKQEWQRLRTELEEAQESAEGKIKKDLVPKLQSEMDDIRRRMDELQKASPQKKPDIET